MRLSLRARLALATGILVGVATLGVAAASYLSLAHSLRGQAADAASAEARRLSGLVERSGTRTEPRAEGNGGGNYVSLTDPSLARQFPRPGVWVVVLNRSGTLVQRSPRAPRALAHAGLTPRCRQTGSVTGTLRQPDATIACRRIGSERAPLGYVVTARSLAEASSTLGTARRTLALAVAGAICSSMLLVFAFASRTLRPLRLIARTARSIREGDIGRRIGYHRRDELGELAAELDASFAELEAAVRRQQAFVADASHELKTPLAALRANLQLLQRRAGSDPSASEQTMAAAERAAARMNRIVADLLHLARGEDRSPGHRELLALDELVLAAIREARGLDHTVRIEVARLDEALVLGDRERLLQLIGNLLDNAVGATPGGVVRVSLREQGGCARLAIADDGPGIPASDLPRIFDRFYRGQTRRRDGGSGLGLAIARAVAGAHGGEIEVETKLGAGTEFTVVLPTATQAPER